MEEFEIHKVWERQVSSAEKVACAEVYLLGLPEEVREALGELEQRYNIAGFQQKRAIGSYPSMHHAWVTIETKKPTYELYKELYELKSKFTQQ